MSVNIEIPKDRIAEFCRTYRIHRLSLFGSVLRDDFRADSDVDVLVEFEADARHSLFDLMHLQDELEGILGRSVDFVQERGLVNPSMRQEILSTREVVYAA